MIATILTDNIAKENLESEWGLSIFITYKDKKILLDTGATDKFLNNAAKLGIDISEVDYGVLSHAHYDHADGMEHFFRNNEKAHFYLRQGCEENCYGKYFIFSRYVGIKKGILEKYKERIIYARGDCEIASGIYLIPHKTEGLSAIGKKNKMYVKKDKWQPDDFSHEQSLVLDTEKGLVIFNSCSHGGVDTIIKEVVSTFPNKKIASYIGGFHLFGKSESEVRTLGKKLSEIEIENIYTGHCTGKKAYRILKEELGDRIEQIKTGMEIHL